MLKKDLSNYLALYLADNLEIEILLKSNDKFDVLENILFNWLNELLKQKQKTI